MIPRAESEFKPRNAESHGLSRMDRILFYNCPPYLLYERPIPYYSIYLLLLLLYYLVVFECL